MKKDFSLPQGVKDFGPDRAENIRKVEEGFLEEFSRWGYKRVITPIFEYLDTITVGLGEELKSKIMKFVDPSTGEIVALRPDITPQIARIVATQPNSNNNFPLRLCYNGRVVRFEDNSSGREREIFQAGCELIGEKSPESDAEIIALPIRSLQKLGLKDLVLDIGHMGILKAVFSELGDLKDEFTIALKTRQFELIEKILRKSTFDSQTQDIIIDFCCLSDGNVSLERLKKKKIFQKQVSELEKVLRILDEYEINCKTIIDLGNIRDFTYYTGITFEIISSGGIFSPMVIGGRYDNLVQKYGYPTPATGFAIDIEQVLSVTRVHMEDQHVHFIVIPQSKKLRHKAIHITQWLRSSGFKVILEVNNKDLQSLSTSYGKIIVQTPQKIELIESKSGIKREFANLEDLFKREL